MPTILVVDDHETVQDVVVELLHDEGFHVIAAPNGRVALEALREIRADLILLDYNMPVMNGPQFACAYQQTPGTHAPIVLMTANGRARAAALEVGADDYLSKPFDLDALVALVRQHAA